MVTPNHTADKGQSTEANQAMDGITPTDINQDKLPSDKQVNTDDSLLDVMEELHQSDVK